MARKNFDEILKEFLEESSEGLQQLDSLLVQLENDRDPARVADIFRVIHSIKGTSGLLGLNNLEMLAHAGEDLLTEVRDGNLIPDKEIITALLEMVDRIRAAMETVSQKKSDAEFNAGSLIARLESLKEAKMGQAKSPNSEAGQESAAAEDPDTAAAPAHAGLGGQHLRVDVSLLDKLMNMVGELVLVRNQILQLGHSNLAIKSSSQKLHQITTELQEGMMKTRMQPVSNLWDRVPRLVRDVSILCNKQVRVEFEGGETELDKTILESIKDPLTHLIRNAIDHGIEAPEVRRAKGKPEEGVIILRAYHDGGQVCIEVSDDGQGIDTARIVAGAIEKGSITAERASRLSEREQKALLFLPGISTSSDVTKVSGRGVGMDVVKTNTERIGGTVDIIAAPHGGTCFRLTIPLTLAIIPALIVVSRGVRYAIPQVNILELVRLNADQAGGIEQARGCSVYRLRGRLIPIQYLHEVLRLRDKDAKQQKQSDGVNLVILQAGMHSFGLAVDDINDTEEIVVKPLARQLKGLTVCSGATIMGDGSVAMILDVIGLARRAGVEVQNETLSRAASATAEDKAIERLVIFRVGKNRRLAMALGLVARLEEFPKDKLENSAGQLVVQYRGGVMPVVALASILNLESDSEGSALAQVIVYEKDGKSVGLIVDEIVDIVEEHVTVHEADFHKNIRGRAVIQGRVTDLLEIPHISELWSSTGKVLTEVS